ncbi:hypothetical protein [Mycolicibacterium sp. lyk4-40-TYG-92]|uniref:hypothetical protein n=1 Tax=Mycolicibacterium sp. lyk4-40-TYG-92 TaxID=3040295 RepID=UPI0025509725|nr:hypothetical protein [Mycolicibacterium sp. lyk4-40-TYG-92]
MSKRSAPTDQDRLDYIDQATFLSYRASGRVQVGMALWFYEGPVDLDGLRRFNENFGKGLVARYIERSPVPFGRHRWVAATGAPRPIDIAENACPRSELSEWLEARSRIPIDPEHGPGWHVGVQHFTDGSTAVAMVLSHCLIDGTGSVVAFMDAVLGNERDLGYGPPRSRTRWQAIRSDLRQTLRDLPEVRRTVAVAAKLAYQRRGEMKSTPSSTVDATGGDEIVYVPFASANVDIGHFDARAAELGGNGYSLVTAFATRLGVRMGRQRARDGAISLMVAINDRTSFEDTRANAMTFTTFTVDPALATTDLTELRGEIRTALRRAREQPDESFQLLPLTPFIPRRAVRHTAAMVLGELPVTCSNVGDVPDLVGRIDGTHQADFVNCWGVEQNVKKADIEQVGGLLVVTALRHNAKVTLGIVGYQVGAENTKAVLREHVQQTLAELGVTPLAVY